MAKSRFQLDFNEEETRKLDELKSKIGEPSRAEVIWTALKLLSAVVKIAETGEPFTTDIDGEEYSLVIQRVKRESTKPVNPSE